MTDRRDVPEVVERCFAVLEAAAVAGRRCPGNDTGAVSSDLVGMLARAGRIKVEIYALNFRVVEIMTGPNAGRRTKARPHDSSPPWKVIDKNGSHTDTSVQRQIARQEPPPRPLSPSNK